ncbi:lipopolysaccharide assembly protein LapA domain-containing protein [Rudaea cellulosilytica]|uniref:lipopolysaccharide assembly protein LapA domain-containing protein n=1 Tax=Rudaea cellulosilytica TaxID=540746 RepID=UPI0003637CF4|nr:lipopolysaccharide assembly protein LapA domain-containing protein [Rudaea cellulosilytica]
MRLIWILLIFVFAAVGALFGALNGEAVAYDFYFATLKAPKGAMLIAAILLGWLLGGAVVYFGLVLRLRRRLRAQMRKPTMSEQTAVATDIAAAQLPMDPGRH